MIFELRTTIVEGFRGSRKFSAAGFFARGVCCPELHPSFVCHSEERSDEESAFGFPVLVERVEKSRCFTSFSMTQQQTPSTEKDSGFFRDLCGFAQVTPTSVAALPRCAKCFLTVNPEELI